MTSEETATHDDLDELARELESRGPFGPAFFVHQLRALIRDRCPLPEDHLPVVEIHLSDGDVLDVCHVMGVTPRWVALAIYDRGPGSSASASPAMATELVPFELVCRVTIRSTRRTDAPIGFNTAQPPPISLAPEVGQSAEKALLSAAGRRAIDADATG